MSIFFKDIIKDITTAMTVSTPVFLYGHLIDITAQLARKTKNGKQKFPLIILPFDITESFQSEGSAYADVSFGLVFCVLTDKNYTPESRYDNSYDVLYPIVEEFKKQMVLSKKFAWLRDPSKIKHDKIDRYNWGRETAYGNAGTILNDYVDAIELRNIEVKIKPNVLACNQIS